MHISYKAQQIIRGMVVFFVIGIGVLILYLAITVQQTQNTSSTEASTLNYIAGSATPTRGNIWGYLDMGYNTGTYRELCKRVGGWAVDRTDVSTKLTVEIYTNSVSPENRIKTTIADKLRDQGTCAARGGSEDCMVCPADGRYHPTPANGGSYPSQCNIGYYIDFTDSEISTYFPLGEDRRLIAVARNENTDTEQVLWTTDSFIAAQEELLGRGEIEANAICYDPTSTPSSTPTDTPEPTATNTPSPTATPVATSVPIPTDTPEPTATNTPSPTATYTPTNTPTPTPTGILDQTPEIGEIAPNEIGLGYKVQNGKLFAVIYPGTEVNYYSYRIVFKLNATRQDLETENFVQEDGSLNGFTSTADRLSTSTRKIVDENGNIIITGLAPRGVSSITEIEIGSVNVLSPLLNKLIWQAEAGQSQFGTATIGPIINLGE